MINIKTITQAIEALFNNNLTGYKVERNAVRNGDPSLASKSGWIGIYRGRVNYEPAGTPLWAATIEIDVEVQCARYNTPGLAEDALTDAETEVLNLLNANKKLGNTVDTTLGYDIEYDYNVDVSQEQAAYFHSSIITIRAEARTST